MQPQAHIALNAHLLSGEASYRSAGIHGYLYNTLAHLPDAAPEFAYTVFVGRGQLPQRPEWHVRRSRLPTHNPLMRILWEQAVAPLVLRQICPDLVHGMGFALPLLWQGPSVVTIFDLSFVRYPQRLGMERRLYLRAVTQASARMARRVITISESSKTEIVALLGIPAEKVDVAPPGVSPDFRPLPAEEVAAFREHQQLPERLILYVGTLEPRKNLETLVHAYARLPQRGAVKLALVGARGWQVESLFALIERLNLTQDILLVGYVPRETLPLWYNVAEVFAYPSIYEGFGMPPVEAMACGIPVVTSNTTSLPEAVGAAGVLLPPTDVDAWAETLARLLDDPAARAERATLGCQHARRFRWDFTARQTAESYRRALGVSR